jgi:uncharacterized phiE125 gp8 family phage protein
MQLHLKIPPTQEPTTLEELKSHLRIASDQEDSFLRDLLASARAYVEGATGRALLKQGWSLELTPPYPPSSPLVVKSQGDLKITLPRPPLLGVESVQTKGKSVPYTAQEDKLTLSSLFWEKPLSIRFWAGYGEDPTALPPDLKMAVLMAARFLYDGQKVEVPLLRPYKVLKII